MAVKNHLTSKTSNTRSQFMQFSCHYQIILDQWMAVMMSGRSRPSELESDLVLNQRLLQSVGGLMSETLDVAQDIANYCNGLLKIKSLCLSLSLCLCLSLYLCLSVCLSLSLSLSLSLTLSIASQTFFCNNFWSPIILPASVAVQSHFRSVLAFLFLLCSDKS